MQQRGCTHVHLEEGQVEVHARDELWQWEERCSIALYVPYKGRVTLRLR